MLVSIISVGLVGFLLAIFLYHLIFVVMDLRQIAKRLNDITAEVEEMVMAPVQVASQAFGWLQKWVFDFCLSDKKECSEKKSDKKKKSSGKKKGKRKK